MWKAIMAVLVVASGAQAYDDLLPEARHITGIVVDATGKPIVAATVDHTGDGDLHQTDPSGRFELDTRAPAIVIWKAGYRSQLVRTQTGGDVQIILQTEAREFPICSDARAYLGIDTSGARFQFLQRKGFLATNPEQLREGSRGGVRFYYIDSQPPLPGIQHLYVSDARFGRPPDQLVWESIKFEESILLAAGDDGAVLDSRGEDANGKRWRTLGKYGERVDYNEAVEEVASRLDEFLEGACLKSALH